MAAKAKDNKTTDIKSILKTITVVKSRKKLTRIAY